MELGKISCILLVLRQNQANVPMSQKPILLYSFDGFPIDASYFQISYDILDIAYLSAQKSGERKMPAGLKCKN